MTADRPYRRALPAAVARAQLEHGAGTQFDAAIVAAFVALLEAEDRAAATAGVPARAPRASRASAASAAR
jgi:HD-GYP domain-containing protein (c-di-GMP phosphodiesterase class II)